MGLDNFWEMPEGAPHPTFEPELGLVGGMFSDFGSGSFRGKVYDEMVRRITGISLYQGRIDNAGVRQIADALPLAEHDPDEDRPKEEFDDLVRMFRAYADAGAALLGWW